MEYRYGMQTTGCTYRMYGFQACMECVYGVLGMGVIQDIVSLQRSTAVTEVLGVLGLWGCVTRVGVC